MSIWLIIWILVSSALIYFSLWTTWVVFKQKDAWNRFAKKNKLRYKAQGFLSSPHVSGVYQGYAVALFPCEHESPDGRGVRKLTAIEVELDSAIPVGGVIGSGGMVSLIQQMDFSNELQPRHKGWDTSHIIRTEDKAVLSEYLTAERLNALAKLAKIKNVWMIFIFRGNDAILRVDTPDPLDRIEKIQKLLHSLLAVAKILELEKGESRRLLEPRSSDAAQKVLAVKDEDLEVSMELEEDEGVSDQEQPEER